MHSQTQKTNQVLTGEEWYVQQAARAVNQAVGRVIRHRHDYGAIILCDERFAQQNRQCQMSYWLRPHIKCYPKFGDVVFTLTRFFKDRASCSSVKPNLAVKLDIQKPVVTQNKSLSSKSHSFLVSDSEHCPSKLVTPLVAVTSGSTPILLGQVVPANRSNLSNNQNFRLTRQRSQDCSQDALQTSESTSASIQHQESKVIDLTSDNPYCEQPGVGFIAPCSSKRPNFLNMHSDVVKRQNISSSIQLYKSDLRNSPPKASSHGSSGISCKQTLPLSVCEPANAGRYDEDKGTQYVQVGPEMMPKHEIVKEIALPPQNKGDARSSSLHRVGTAERGSTFLLQVQEKLTPDEYKEFVGLMKALKSKTMKITAVLERIATLFSAPQRFLLLKGFKDFVPAKFRPTYEQHLKALDS